MSTNDDDVLKLLLVAKNPGGADCASGCCAGEIYCAVGGAINGTGDGGAGGPTCSPRCNAAHVLTRELNVEASPRPGLVDPGFVDVKLPVPILEREGVDPGTIWLGVGGIGPIIVPAGLEMAGYAAATDNAPSPSSVCVLCTLAPLNAVPALEPVLYEVPAVTPDCEFPSAIVDNAVGGADCLPAIANRASTP